jgi:hypothetical protein
MGMTAVIPLLVWAMVGPQIPSPELAPLAPEVPGVADVLPSAPAGVPEAVPGADVVKEPEILAGCHTVTGGAAGCAIGGGVPLAAVGASAGFLAWLIPQGLAGTLTGAGPAAASLATGFCVIIPAMACFPMTSTIMTTAGAVWGTQRDGGDPWGAVLGALPGLGLATLATGLIATTMVMGMFGLGLIGPTLIVGVIAALVAIPAPAVAYVGAVWGSALYPGIQANIAMRKRAAGVLDDQAMAY